MNLKILLTDVLNLSFYDRNLKESILKFGYDHDDLVELTRSIMLGNLNYIIKYQPKFALIEEWANFIEARDGILINDIEVNDVVFELANPSLYDELSIKRVKEMHRKLK